MNLVTHSILTQVLDDQTALVRDCIDNGMFTRCDIQNTGDGLDIEHWYAITRYLADELISRGSIVLCNEYGQWWGLLDPVITLDQYIIDTLGGVQ